MALSPSFRGNPTPLLSLKLQEAGGLMLGSITIFTNSIAIEPDGLAIIITLSLLLIILIISINYKQEQGPAGGALHLREGVWAASLALFHSWPSVPFRRPDLRDTAAPT